MGGGHRILCLKVPGEFSKNLLRVGGKRGLCRVDVIEVHRFLGLPKNGSKVLGLMALKAVVVSLSDSLIEAVPELLPTSSMHVGFQLVNVAIDLV